MSLRSCWRVAAETVPRWLDHSWVSEQPSIPAKRTESSNKPRLAALAIGTGLAIALSGCALQSGDSTSFTPSPIITESPTPTASPSTATPSAVPTTEPVDATGSMSMYMTVTKKLSGTCQTTEDGPTIKLTDRVNDFYEVVDFTILLGEDKVQSIDGTFKTDTEGFAWTLSYDALNPVAKTSAKLTASDNKYTISGKLQAVQTRKSKTRTEVLPFKITATCASSEW